MIGRKRGEKKTSSHLCAGKEVWVGLDSCNDLTQDDTIGEYIGLKTDGHTQTHDMKNQNVPYSLFFFM